MKFSKARSFSIFVVGLALGLVVLWQLVQPVRTVIANRYIVRGDTYMNTQDFDLASGEYAQALKIDPDNSLAQSRMQLAKEGPVNIAALLPYYQAQGIGNIVSAIEAAEQPYTDPKKALQAGANLYASDEFDLAQYPMQEAVKLDPGYPEAWNYLGLDYQQLASYNSSYTAKAKQAFTKRDNLTPDYLSNEG